MSIVNTVLESFQSVNESSSKVIFAVWDGDGGIIEDNIPTLSEAVKIFNKEKGSGLISMSDGNKNYVNFDVKGISVTVTDGLWDGVDIK